MWDFNLNMMYLDNKSQGKSIALMRFHFLVCKIRVFVSMSKVSFYFITVSVMWFIVFSAWHWRHSSRSTPLSPTDCPAEGLIRSFVFAHCVRSSRPVNPYIKLQSDDLSWWDFQSPCSGSDPVGKQLKWTIYGCLWEVAPGTFWIIKMNWDVLFIKLSKTYPCHGVSWRGMQLDTCFTHKSFPPLLAAAAGRSSLLWVISCQALYLNILHPAQFKVQVSPEY